MRVRSRPTKQSFNLEALSEGTPHINGRRIFSSINGFDRNQNTYLRRDLNQPATSHRARLRPAKSAAVAPLQWIRSLPWRPSSFSVYSGSPEHPDDINSTNAVGDAFRATESQAAIRRFSLPPSR
jgi:hypothetical protein